MSGFEVHPAAVILGLGVGVVYGVLAVGFVLIHRTSRFINLAHAQVGVFAAAIVAVAVHRWGFPYWAAFVLALAVAACVGAFTELTVVRRLRRAPTVVGVVATLGLGQVLLLLALAVEKGLDPLPEPSWLPSLTVGPLYLSPAHVGLLTIPPLAVLGLAAFLRFTRAGMAMRGAASEESLARLVGIPARRAGTLAWAIAGGLSAVVVILALPTFPGGGGEVFGLGLLARGLAAAAIAGLRSLAGAFVAGLGIGVLEQVLFWNVAVSGPVAIVVFAAVATALLARGRHREDAADRERWRALGPPPQPRAAVILIGAGVAAGLILASTNATAITMAAVGAYALVGLSIVIVTGLGGHLSLGQFAIAGIGGLCSVLVVAHTGNFVLGFGAAMVGAAVAAAGVGLPALRLRGSALAVTTLLFAFLTHEWLLQQPWTLGSGRDPGRPIVGTFAFESGRSYALLTLSVTVAVLLAASALWRTRFRLRVISLRDNEAASRSFGMSPAVTTILAFGVGGAVAGIGGALYAHRSSFVSAETFPVSASVLVVGIAAVGGLASPLGAAVGALYVVGLPLAVSLDSAGLAATAAGWLILLLYVPGGLAQALARLARWARPPPAGEPPPRGDPIEVLRPHERAADVGGELLSAHALRRTFGELIAVDDASLTLERGEIVALVGPNGAGKTTLLDVLTGFQRAEGGTVRFGERDVTRWSPQRRASTGLMRSFQDPVLFPTLSVLETVRLAVARALPVPGADRLETRRDTVTRAERLVAAVGLDPDQPAHQLSQGMRRTLQLISMATLGPRALLLDEPSAGLAAPEVEALEVLLRRFRDELGITLLFVSHELALVAAVADRAMLMEAGRIVWTGVPAGLPGVGSGTARGTG